MRVIVTGSRDWDDEACIESALTWVLTETKMHPSSVIVVHGACPTGADAIVDVIAQDLGCQVERHPADWKTFGKSAGFRRNKEMVDLGAAYTLAFIKNGSRGASHTAGLSEDAGILTARYLR